MTAAGSPGGALIESVQWVNQPGPPAQASNELLLLGNIADVAGAEIMKLFRKKLKKQDEKVLAEASDLATRKLEQYFADRKDLPPLTKDVPKKSALTRLRWW